MISHITATVRNACPSFENVKRKQLFQEFPQANFIKRDKKALKGTDNHELKII